MAALCRAHVLSNSFVPRFQRTVLVRHQSVMSLKGNNTKSYKKGDAEPPLAPGAARIYSMLFCPFAERTLIYAQRKKLSIEIVNIDLTEKPEWYFKKHPKGQVPAYEKDGKCVIESSHIPLFLDDLHPESSVLPSDPFARAQQRILAEQLGQLSSTYFGLFRLFANPETMTPEALAKVVEANLNSLDETEKLLPDGQDYFGGSSASYADYMTFPFFEKMWVGFVGFLPELLNKQGVTGVDLSIFPTNKDAPFPSASRWPKLTKWFGLLVKAEEVVAVAQPFENTLHYYEMRLNRNIDYDYGL